MGTKLPPLAEKLLATDNCWEKESWFSLRVWSLLGPSWASVWPHTLEYWTAQIILDWMRLRKKSEDMELDG